MAFHQARVLFEIGIEFLELIHFFAYLPENVCDRLQCIASQPVKKRITWLYIQFDCCDAGTILSTVVRLFHEQVQLVKPP